MAITRVSSNNHFGREKPLHAFLLAPLSISSSFPFHLYSFAQTDCNLLLSLIPLQQSESFISNKVSFLLYMIPCLIINHISLLISG